MANLKGAKPDKLMRDALLLELHQDATLPDGQKVKRLRVVANALIEKAIEGDVAAIKEINDRIDGKVPQATTIAGDAENPLHIAAGPRSELETARQVAFLLAQGAQKLGDDNGNR